MADLLFLMGFLGEAPKTGPVLELEVETSPHLTIAPAFSLDDNSIKAFCDSLFGVVPKFLPHTFSLGENAYFGAANEIPVKLVEKDLHIQELHETVMGILTKLGGQVAAPAYVNAGFTPHISHWGERAVEPQTLSHLTLVRHDAGFGQKVNNLITIEGSPL